MFFQKSDKKNSSSVKWLVISEYDDNQKLQSRVRNGEGRKMDDVLVFKRRVTLFVPL